MRYRLRTLLILLAVGPPLVAVGWLLWSALLEEPQDSIWESELSLIHGSGLTVESEDEASPETPDQSSP
jgi:hypothetical protein